MIDMNIVSKSKLLALALSAGVALVPLRTAADDIDIFIGSSGGSAAAPNVMILIDNSPNWSRASQQWPDAPTQGDAELRAISSVLNSITTPTNVGVAMLTSSTPNGGYIRFGARDMTVAANKTALQNIVAGILVNSPSEKLLGMPNKDESAGIYELYKYFSGLAPFAGAPANNPNADVAGNTNPLTGAGQGLTTGFAFKPDGTYNPPTSPCAKSYIIYIANNANNTGASGQATYEPPSGANAGPALTPTALDTWTDEWAKFLFSNSQVVTFVLDAFNAQQNAAYSASLQNAAKMGGGDYTQVSSQAAITSTLLRIFANIQSVNTTFASASLPVNATNRAQNQNQVFVGMFRPDPDAKPRWFGNMKQYQLVNNAGIIGLGDVNGNPAVNTATGFLADCATSFWTSDSGTYWQTVVDNPNPAGRCPLTSFNKFSDSPDGPIVEKGAVAEVVRKGNNPPTTDATPTFAVNRTVNTLSAGVLTSFSTTSSGLPANVVNFTLGQDVNDENGNLNVTETRPSLHGDVIHSRPLPINYGGATGVVVYYGANDGTLRAVNAATGKELWAFVAPEHFSKLARLMNQSPLVNYPNLPATVTPAPQPKDYFFDGSTGIFQNLNNTQVWIYPSMRRGGRAVYAFDVTTPSTPSFKWKVGCPNPTDDVGCSAGMTGIGQTWSQPSAAFIKGFSTTVPVVIFGGGYDSCEDQNTSTPTCTTPKGAAVYILNANDGTVLATFSTTRSVIAEIALLDIDADGLVDYAYAVDTGGNIYRIDFYDGPATRTPLTSAQWVMNKVAFTSGAGRKFEFPPALLLNGGKVYVALGSGDREHPLASQYPFLSVVNRFYMYVDDLATRTVLTNLDDITAMIDYSANTTCSSPPVTPTSTQRGWFMTLSGQGEQTVTSAVIAGGTVTFSTNRPIPAALGTCSTTLGEARGYILNVLNGSGAIGVTGSCGGTRYGIFVGGGLPPSPVLGTIPVGGVPKTVVIGAIQKSGSSSSPIEAQQVRPTISSRRTRTYWYTPGLDN